MSNDNQLERLWKLQAKVNMLVLDGKRDPKFVADTLQGVLDNTSPRSWCEKDGIIYFSVKSDGTTGEDWIKRLEGNSFRVGDYAKRMLRSPSFVPTSGVVTEVAVLKVMSLWGQGQITSMIRAEADKRNLSKPDVELACLIREKFTDREIKAMGLWHIVAMHEPIKDSIGGLLLLGAGCDVGGGWLDAYGSTPSLRWHRNVGFAFRCVVSISSQH